MQILGVGVNLREQHLGEPIRGGMDSYITKSCKTEDMIFSIHKLLGK